MCPRRLSARYAVSRYEAGHDRFMSNLREMQVEEAFRPSHGAGSPPLPWPASWSRPRRWAVSTSSSLVLACSFSRA